MQGNTGTKDETVEELFEEMVLTQPEPTLACCSIICIAAEPEEEPAV